jgi:hypothetical protein
MGYTVRYPASWTVTTAREPWLAGASEFWDDPNGDRIESADAGFRGGSQKLAAGQTAEAWLEAYLGTGPPVSCGTVEHIPLAGAQATIDMNGCQGMGRLGGRLYDVALVTGGRGYNLTMEGAVDHALLLAMLATVEFDPWAAID